MMPICRPTIGVAWVRAWPSGPPCSVARKLVRNTHASLKSGQPYRAPPVTAAAS